MHFGCVAATGTARQTRRANSLLALHILAPVCLSMRASIPAKQTIGPMRWACLVVIFLSLAGGCGESAGGKLGISGNITLSGQPLDEGAIIFEPQASGSTSGSPAYAVIANGKYSIPAGQGLDPGTYVVRISAPQVAAISGEPGEPLPAAKDRVGPEFNTNSTLTFDLQAGSQTFDQKIP